MLDKYLIIFKNRLTDVTAKQTLQTETYFIADKHIYSNDINNKQLYISGKKFVKLFQGN